MIDFMIDLETWGTEPGSAIASIGACVVGESEARFYQVVELESCLAAGLKVSGGTVQFWLSQPDAARLELLNKARIGLWEALSNLTDWLEMTANARNVTNWKDEVCVWGNGANFDPPLLEAAYRAVNLLVPWAFFQVRCYRTMKGLVPHVRMEPPAVKHHALHDAAAQAEHLCRIFECLSIRDYGIAAARRATRGGDLHGGGGA
jgi:hypothetical protein